MKEIKCTGSTTKSIITRLKAMPRDEIVELVYWNGNKSTTTVLAHLRELQGLFTEETVFLGGYIMLGDTRAILKRKGGNM